MRTSISIRIPVCVQLRSDKRGTKSNPTHNETRFDSSYLWHTCRGLIWIERTSSVAETINRNVFFEGVVRSRLCLFKQLTNTWRAATASTPRNHTNKALAGTVCVQFSIRLDPHKKSFNPSSQVHEGAFLCSADTTSHPAPSWTFSQIMVDGNFLTWGKWRIYLTICKSDEHHFLEITTNDEKWHPVTLVGLLTLSPERGLFFGRLGVASSLGLVSMAQ